MDKIPNKTCSKCGAHWIEGQLYWQTGAKGKNEDLAGLVCNRLPDEDIPECINSKRGDISGQTWEYRRGFIDGVLEQATKR